MKPLYNETKNRGEGIGACLIMTAAFFGVCYLLGWIVNWLFTHVKII